ncbi:hypothetical protein BJ085DRAFT_30408 [Dimargaris cristalligena]|uniref:Uncharacterized protein n=1 Tax=Dimargaris cristalligena TaxID=215637 RepID=A0A4P9ZJ95_9FUNG|nr:hypothetical protein BJ085DRAFT_30408 [Dimargaris cristalligena]|eukprot:RKP33277.1 hypothetical protein BJ085DRAFT_30408 [Dimargaris cristalligena]
MLTVGLLINLVEDCAPNRVTLASLDLVTGEVTPIPTSSTTPPRPLDPSNVVAYLARLFVLIRQAPATPSVEDKVLAVYLAVLLGCLMKENPANQAAIRLWLPNGGSLHSIIELLEEFHSAGEGAIAEHHGSLAAGGDGRAASLQPASPEQRVSKPQSFASALEDPNISTEALLKLHTQGSADSELLPIPTPEATGNDSQGLSVLQSFQTIIDLLYDLEKGI